MTDMAIDLNTAMDAVADLELTIVTHRMFDDAIEAMNVLHARALQCRRGKRLRAHGMLLLGAAGAGKTTVVQHFLDKHQAYQTPDGIIMPVVVVEVPPAPTLRAIVDALYSALGYRAEQRLSAEEIVKDLTKKVDFLGVATILLDESHHILASRESADVTEFIKSLLNRLGCSMIFSGLPALEDLHRSLQLSRRLSPDVVLRSYNFGNTVDRLEFMSFLAAIEQNTMSHLQSSISDQDVARRLYAASGGLIGIVTKYLSQALLLASLRGLGRLDLDLLAEIDASWSGGSVALDDVGFDADIDFDEGEDIAGMLAAAGRTRIDKATNPFKCKPGRLREILEERIAKKLVEPPRRRLDGRMKGVGPDPQRGLK